MTRTTDRKADKSKRRIISFEPTPQSMAFLEEKKESGVPYAFTIEKALEQHRKAKR